MKIWPFIQSLLGSIEQPVMETALPLAEKAADAYIAAQTGPLAPVAVLVANTLIQGAESFAAANIPVEEQLVAAHAAVTNHPAVATAAKAA